jgi:RsiW-degrading membrane proteinase PrsW (M82 family)
VGIFLAALVVAFVPALLYVLFFRLLDVYEKEPLWFITCAFAWGAIPAVMLAGVAEIIGSIVVSSGVSADPGSAQGIGAAVLAPLFEEGAKALFLAAFFFAFRRQIDSPLDGLVVGATIGLGFAASENVLYLLSGYGDGGLGGFVFIAIVRIVFLGFGHALFTGVTGLGFSYARLGKGVWKVLGPILGLIGGMALHATWNGSLVLGQPLVVFAMHWLLVIGMIVLVGFVLANERKWMRVELYEEVQYGLISAEEMRRASSVWRRIGTELGALFTGGPGSLRAKERFYRDMSALASCKHNLRTLGDDPAAPAEIQALRARLAPDRQRAQL